MKKLLIPIMIFLLSGINVLAQRDIFIGGNIGTGIPLNIKAKNDIGYGDVANAGVLLGINGLWMYETRLSLGAELNYQYNPADYDFWRIDPRYGDITAHYQTLSLMFSGAYYFSHRDVRPFIGIAFGGFYIFNDLTFISSYTGTDNDRSVSYKTNLVRPGFAPVIGVVFRLNKNTFLKIGTKLVFIPNIPDQYEEVLDENGYVIKVINKNPHVNQHHLQLSLALLFGV
jgi:hypothetical protein